MLVGKPRVSPQDRISASFKELAKSATLLNTASDELAKAIGPIDAALKKLNLGVTAWHPYAKGEDENGNYWQRRIGYARVGRKWGLALSTVSGNEFAEFEDDEEWLFSDAPRWMRLEALDHIPDLLEILVKRANEVAGQLQKKSELASELAAMISVLSASTEARR